jgi:hypothetical protein
MGDRNYKPHKDTAGEFDKVPRFVYGGYEYDPRTKLRLGRVEDLTDTEEILVQILNPDQLALEGLKRERK